MSRLVNSKIYQVISVQVLEILQMSLVFPTAISRVTFYDSLLIGKMAVDESNICLILLKNGSISE
jgi:hypothetical protein